MKDRKKETKKSSIKIKKENQEKFRLKQLKKKNKARKG